MKILVLGYFGYESNQLDGQTMRTRSIYSLLQSNTEDEIYYFDTQSVRSSKFNVLKLIKLIMEVDIIFSISAQRNLKYLFPLLYILSRITKKRLNYVSVGGWLTQFLESKPMHRYILRKINGVYVQTENLYTGLCRNNFNNIYLLNNFRNVSYPSVQLSKKSGSKMRLVFMARVNPLKGVDLLFELEEKVKALGLVDFSIDIYGPILKSYKDIFLTKISNSSIEYCGVIDPKDIYSTLENYDLMLFPTKYYTEGFPGSILDAYISGLPVIVSNWLNATEFVDEGVTGYIVEFNNDSLFIEKTINLIRNPSELISLKENVRSKRYMYSAEAAWKVLHTAIYS